MTTHNAGDRWFLVARFATVALTTIGLAGLAVGRAAAAPAPPASAPSSPPAGPLFSLVREPNGHLAVDRATTTAVPTATDAVRAPGSEVLAVERDVPVSTMQTAGENDPMRPKQWALDRTSFERAWFATRGSGVKVAVVDSGIDAAHQDLGSVVLPGIDYIDRARDGRYALQRAPYSNVDAYVDVSAPARTATGRGYWLVSARGAVFAFGDARFYGGMNRAPLNAAIVAMAATPSGHGYILLAADGGIFTFGDARFHGSTGGMRLNARVLDLAMTRSGNGYWFVAADGGVFSFGDARFHGSTGGMRLAAPVTSMSSSSDGRGYWLVAADGGIFAFNVPFEGSIPWIRELVGGMNAPTMRMRALASNDGYYLLGLDGSITTFGTARFFGSAVPNGSVDVMLAR